MHKSRNPVSQGGSGSAQHEDGAESAAPQRVPDPVIIPDSGVAVEDTTRVAEGPVPKKRKIVASKPPKGKDPIIEQVICNEEGIFPDGEPVRIGAFTLQEIASTLSDIPTDGD